MTWKPRKKRLTPAECATDDSSSTEWPVSTAPGLVKTATGGISALIVARTQTGLDNYNRLVYIVIADTDKKGNMTTATEHGPSADTLLWAGIADAIITLAGPPAPDPKDTALMAARKAWSDNWLAQTPTTEKGN